MSTDAKVIGGIVAVTIIIFIGGILFVSKQSS